MSTYEPSELELSRLRESIFRRVSDYWKFELEPMPFRFIGALFGRKASRYGLELDLFVAADPRLHMTRPTPHSRAVKPSEVRTVAERIIEALEASGELMPRSELRDVLTASGVSLEDLEASLAHLLLIKRVKDGIEIGVPDHIYIAL